MNSSGVDPHLFCLKFNEIFQEIRIRFENLGFLKNIFSYVNHCSLFLSSSLVWYMFNTLMYKIAHEKCEENFTKVKNKNYTTMIQDFHYIRKGLRLWKTIQLPEEPVTLEAIAQISRWICTTTFKVAVLPSWQHRMITITQIKTSSTLWCTCLHKDDILLPYLTFKLSAECSWRAISISAVLWMLLDAKIDITGCANILNTPAKGSILINTGGNICYILKSWNKHST